MRCDSLARKLSVLLIAVGLIVSAADDSWCIELTESDTLAIHTSDATELTLIGKDLRTSDGKIASIWCSAPATIEPIDSENKDANRVRFRFTPKKPLAGIVALRAFTKDSISREIYLPAFSTPVTELPKDEQPVEVPCAMDVRSADLGEFKIPIKLALNQRIFAEVVAARIGSPGDAVLILQDDKGREIAYSDDHSSFGNDPLVEHRSTYAGLHFLVVRDVEYRGGLRMLVMIRESPFWEPNDPGAMQIGETRNLRMLVSGNKFVAQSRDDAAGICFLRNESVATPVFQSELPVRVESENLADREMPIPSMVCGSLLTKNEIDRFPLVAKQGDRLIIRTHDIGGAFVGHLRLLHKAKVLGEYNGIRQPNGQIVASLPADGRYVLEVSDAFGRGDSLLNYGISVRNDLAPATLKVSAANDRKKGPNSQPHRFFLSPDKSIKIAVRAERRGYDGPIQILAEIDKRACHVEGNLPDKKNDTEIMVSFRQPVENTFLGSLRLWGECEIDGRKLPVPLDLTEHITKEFPTMRFIPGSVAHAMAVVVPADQPIETEEPVETEETGESEK